jgi:hypothetical protein
MPEPLRRGLLTELYRHGCFLEPQPVPLHFAQGAPVGRGRSFARARCANSLWFRARAAGLFHFLETTTAAACFIRMEVAYVLAPARRPPVQCCSAAPHGSSILRPWLAN